MVRKFRIMRKETYVGMFISNIHSLFSVSNSFCVQTLAILTFELFSFSNNGYEFIKCPLGKNKNYIYIRLRRIRRVLKQISLVKCHFFESVFFLLYISNGFQKDGIIYINSNKLNSIKCPLCYNLLHEQKI